MKEEFTLFVKDKLLDFIDGSSRGDFSEVSIKTPALKLVIKREKTEVSYLPVFNPPVVTHEETLKPVSLIPEQHVETVKSRWVGIFYYYQEKGKPALKVGDNVEEGQLLGTVHCMNLNFEVKSPVNGEIVEILVDNEEKVQYNTLMFRLNKRREE